jgi:hypothetical protein
MLKSLLQKALLTLFIKTISFHFNLKNYPKRGATMVSKICKGKGLVLFVFCLLSALAFHRDATAAVYQTPWQEKTVQGFSIENNKLDYTEGFGAYIDLPLRPHTKNFDNGGGTHDLNSLFLRDHFGVTNIVYDPFQRSNEHNQKALLEAAKQDFDSSTSNSILNVIDNNRARFEHILLSCQAVKNNKAAYFRVWRGNGSGQEQWHSGKYQSNKPAKSYQAEVENVFGKGNVVTDTERHLIIAYKNSGCIKAMLDNFVMHKLCALADPFQITEAIK